MKKIISLIMVVMIFLTACSSGSSNDGIFTRAASEPEGLDIATISYSQSFDVAANNFSGIYEVSGDGSLQLDGAESVDISEDGLTYTVKLKQGLKWVDNTGAEKGEVTANDYLFAYERVLTNEASKMAYLLQGVIAGANDVINGSGSMEDLGIKAIDDYTLEFTLNYAAPYFEGMLAFPTYYPQSKAAFEEYGDEFAKDATKTWYNGSFYTESYDPSYEVVQKKNEMYWDADSVTLNGVVFRTMNDADASKQAFSSGEIDYFETSDENMYTEGLDGQPITDRLTGYSFFMSLNNEEGSVTANKNLREALYYGFNREEILEGASGAINSPIEYFVPKGITEVTYDGLEYRDYAEESYGSYDVERAKTALQTYMDEMGYSDPSEVVIKFLINDSSGGKKTAEAVQAQYANSLGIDVQANILPSAQYTEQRANGEFDMAGGAWGPDYADPSSYLDIFTTANINNVNSARYSNADYDAGVASATVITDPVKRMEAYAALEKQLLEDYAIIPYYQANQPYFIRDGYEMASHLFLKISDKHTVYSAE